MMMVEVFCGVALFLASTFSLILLGMPPSGWIFVCAGFITAAIMCIFTFGAQEIWRGMRALFRKRAPKTPAPAQTADQDHLTRLHAILANSRNTRLIDLAVTLHNTQKLALAVDRPAVFDTQLFLLLEDSIRTTRAANRLKKLMPEQTKAVQLQLRSLIERTEDHLKTVAHGLTAPTMASLDLRTRVIDTVPLEV